MKLRPLLVALLVVVGLIGSVAAADLVKGQWRSPVARVDGLIADWSTLTVVSKEVTAGAANDDQWLHLAIGTSDAATKQRLMGSGLIVYLDPAGNKAKTFGVRLPPLQPRAGFGRRGAGSGDASDSPPPGSRTENPAWTYVEILGPEKDQVHIVDLAEEGLRPIEVAMGNNSGTLLIELAVPLRPFDGHPYSPNVSATKTIVGLGLVTPSESAQTGRGGPTGGMSGGGGRGGGGMGGRGGGMGGRGGGGMGGRGGGMNGGMREAGGGQAKPLNVWTRIELARQPRS